MPARYVSGSSFAGGHQVPFFNCERGSPLPMPLVGLFLLKYGEGPGVIRKNGEVAACWIPGAPGVAGFTSTDVTELVGETA